MQEDSEQQNWVNNLPNMTYEKRSDQLFQQKIDTGSLHYSSSGLLSGEMDAVLGMNAVSGDNMSPHHIPSAHPIEGNDEINRQYGALLELEEMKDEGCQ
ncbi:MAG: hypothetical protein HDR11_16955 [Lachnospiraceae bacterium]|nr:hypothetical protein [Lachnospiraceae bacterium]